jgi:hypothetical protein
MFTSANLAASRLTSLESQDCFRRKPEVKTEESVNGRTLGKGRQGKKPLGSALVSVAALISKLDEEQPTQWESRSAPTLQLRPVCKPDEGLKLFLQRVEKHRVNREESQADATPIEELNWLEAQTAYSLLMKHCGTARDFVTASDNRFNASTSILTARAEAILLAERLLRRLDDGFSVNTLAWTLTAPNTDNTPALFDSCRTPQNIKVTVQNCQDFSKEQQSLKDAKMKILLDEVSQEVSQAVQKPSQRSEIGVLPRLITGILESAERLPRLNVADVPVNAMAAATTIN